MDNSNENEVTKKLINLLSTERTFNPPWGNFIIKKRLTGKSKSLTRRCCHTGMLTIKEIRYKIEGSEEIEDGELNCTYFFCENCGKRAYSTPQSNLF